MHTPQRSRILLRLWSYQADIDWTDDGAAFVLPSSAIKWQKSLVLDGRFDSTKNPNGDADVGGQLAVHHPGEASLDSTTGSVGFSVGAIELYGGDFSVGSDTTAEVY